MTNAITPDGVRRLAKLFKDLGNIRRISSAMESGGSTVHTAVSVSGVGSASLTHWGELVLPGNGPEGAHGDEMDKIKDLLARIFRNAGNNIRAEIAALGGDAGEPLQIPGNKEPTGEERLAKALQNLLVGIEDFELPTHTNTWAVRGCGGISGAIDDANNLLQALGFEPVKVTYRDMPEPLDPDAGMHVIYDGDLGGGFTLYGPFGSDEEASNVADSMNLPSGNVLQVTRPPKRD